MIATFSILFFEPVNAVVTIASSSRVDSSNLPLPMQVDFGFGSAVANLGPLDGVGESYLAIGAANAAEGGFQRGSVWLVTLDSVGMPDSSRVIGAQGASGPLPLVNRDAFGISITSIGDLDGDDVEDIAVGAAGDDQSRGAVWILFMNGDGSVKSFKRIGNPKSPGCDPSECGGGFPAGRLQPGDEFGVAVAALGDLDGGGSSELALAVGAWQTDPGTSMNTGSVFILFLNSSGDVLSLHEISTSSGDLPAGSIEDGDFFGRGLAAMGDLDGDGRIELAVGAAGHDGFGVDRGAIWILSLAPNGLVSSHTEISQTAGFAGDLMNGDLFGIALSRVDDLDGNGVDDLLGTASADDALNQTDQGAVWILLLESDGSVLASCEIDGTGNGFSGGLSDMDRFGTAVDFLGDYNADGGLDFAVGASKSSVTEQEDGRVWILSLESDFNVHETRDAIHFDFWVTNTGNSPIDYIQLSDPRVVFDDATPPDTSVVFLGCGIEDSTAVTLPPPAPGRWCRLTPDGRDAWWFFSPVDSAQMTPSMHITFPAVQNSIAQANAGSYEVDYVLGAGAVQITHGKFRFIVNPPVPSSLRDPGSPIASVRKLLRQNVPNPFNPRTTIRYVVPASGHVRLTIHDVRGRLVRTLVHARQHTGVHRVVWGGDDQSGQRVASGAYYYQLEVNGTRESLKMILLK